MDLAGKLAGLDELMGEGKWELMEMAAINPSYRAGIDASPTPIYYSNYDRFFLVLKKNDA